MTFDAREKSQYLGAPVECYRFSQGTSLWLWTSADQAVVLPTGTYSPETISRGEIEQSEETQAGSLEVRVPRSNALAARFVLWVPETPVSLILYRAHRGEESSPAVRFIGTVASASFEGAEAVLTCVPISRQLERTVPALRIQTQCNWALFSPRCGLLAADWTDTVVATAVSGVQVTSASFAARADGWYTSGWLEAPDGARRFIVDHVGDTVTIVSPIATLALGQTVKATAGCDRLHPTCAGKFGNLVNHAGFAYVPGRNPHTSSVV